MYVCIYVHTSLINFLSTFMNSLFHARSFRTLSVNLLTMIARGRVYYAFYLVLILILLSVLSLYFAVNLCGSKAKAPTKIIYKAAVDLLYDDIRILCMIPYNYNNPSTVQYVKRTWGKHCNVLLFVSGNIDNELEPYVPEINGTDNWTLVHRGLIHAFKVYKDEVDWFLKVEDSSFVVIENLRHIINSKKLLPTAPIYFGHELENTYTHKPFVFSKSGYVISHEALRRYVDLDRDPKTSHCQHLDGFTEELELSRCLRRAGVTTIDSLDDDGNETFMPVHMNHHFLEGYDYINWLKDLAYHKVDTVSKSPFVEARLSFSCWIST
ncbi:glycoprotein-N-acetylgalactosamine 3-beta-galactosyltransferase 1 isoform X2 [Drosophila subobscura]|uniref:glycoprotein-N-acetylgalactosamine 3-beta-galactosyltransferase 1 isoform X2 n=1 Tax=Drosophila subobscura TaxID=7241 RepID=UPI00155A5487|nr:glycoprotein-N-acetylgalactosamine 3-beta-galactosyltransferase 1 isoform X2 [Drosophila subobscura]